jgi:hypothetical protein
LIPDVALQVYKNEEVTEEQRVSIPNTAQLLDVRGCSGDGPATLNGDESERRCRRTERPST